MSVNVPGVKHAFGGKEYVLPPLCLGDVEDHFEGINNFEQLPFRERISLLIDLTTAALQRNYPDLTRDVVRRFIGLENGSELFAALMNISDLEKKGPAPGEA